MLEALKGLLSIPSVAQQGDEMYSYGPGPSVALEYTLELCKKMGFRTKNAGRYGYAEIGQGYPIIGVLGHLDVVPAGEGWVYPPFAGTVADGRLYGRGASDDKGPMIMCIFAAHDLAESYAAAGKSLPCRIRLIFGLAEETGIWTDMGAYCAQEEPISCGFTPDGEFPAIFCEKGMLVVNLSLPLKESDPHSGDGGTAPNVVPDRCVVEMADGRSYTASGTVAHGATPWKGENAINTLMSSLAQDSVPVAKAYMDLLGDDVYGRKLGIACRSEDSGPLSVNVGMLRVEDDNLNLTLDIRYPEDQDAKILLKKIRQAVVPYGGKASFIRGMNPVYRSKNDPLMQQLLRAYRKETGDFSEPIAIGGGTYARAMDGIVAFGPTFPGQDGMEHQANEYVSLEDLERLRRIYCRALQYLTETISAS